jgi:HSF-type DNA-binding
MKRAARHTNEEDRLQRKAKIEESGGYGEFTTFLWLSGALPGWLRLLQVEQQHCKGWVCRFFWSYPCFRLHLTQTGLLTLTVATAPTALKPVATGKPKTAKDKPPERKAKNFAERLMHVLEHKIGSDTVWWVGEGKAVAIHARNLKESDLLSQHFRVKDYSVFIRNCNRW